MEEIRYAPSLLRLAGIVGVLVAPLRGFIGDVYASDSRRVCVSSVFLSRAQRLEIARRLAQLQGS